MNAFVLASGIVAALTYVPFCRQIKNGKTIQNLPTWVLWTVLDVIIAASIIANGGNFVLSAVYAIGSGASAFFIFKSKSKFSWTWFETMVAVLVLASMVVWYFSGSKVATVASTLAMVIAGIPQLVDAWKKPWEMPPLAIYSGYVAASLLSVAGGKSWTVEERLFPVAACVLCLFIVIFSLRKFWIKPAGLPDAGPTE